MSDARPTVPEPAPPDGGERRRLDHAPGERYARRDPAGAAGPGGRTPGDPRPDGRRRRRRAIVAAVLVADAAAVLFFLLGLLDLGGGLLAIAAFSGWMVALALVWGGRDAVPGARLRVGLASLLGGWAVVGGILLDWMYAVVIQLGVLGPLDYVGERYGLVAPVSVLLAAGVAALRAR
jgi:hypothetical protein